MDIVLKTLKTLEFDKIQEKVSGFAKTQQSKNLALNAKIYDDYTNIIKALNYTKEAKNLLDFALDIPIGFVANISEIQKNAQISYLNEEELIDIEDRIVYTLSDDKDEFTVRKDGKVFVVEGPAAERLVGRINIDDNESMFYFEKCLRSMGAETKLKELGIKEGDIVKFSGFEFEWYE